MAVDYTQLFRNLREARGLTLEQLARLARVHRNTIVNLESGRQVRFKTIAALMKKMGYGPESAESKSMALLWLEAVSGILLSRSEAEAVALKTISGMRTKSRERAAELQQAIAEANLSSDQIDLLLHVVRHPAFLTIIENVRDLASDLAAEDESAAELRAAESKAPYSGRK